VARHGIGHRQPVTVQAVSENRWPRIGRRLDERPDTAINPVRVCLYDLSMILATLVAAVGLGIAAQVIAERFQVPAILPLLILGILCGPSALQLFDPSSLGDVLEVLIHLGVAIILFEGGLTLDPKRLLEVGGPVRNLLTIGTAVTTVGAGAAAHYGLDLPWSTAILFGAIVSVTGPTVIVPLLRHMIAPRQVKTVLLTEGLLIDPIGAVLAYFVLQWMERAGFPMRELVGQLAELSLTGLVLGFAAGALAKLVVRTRLVAGELRNLSILALLMVCFQVAEHQAPQSGILAAVVMGITMSAADLPDLVSVKAFKGQLTTLVISSLFILLAGKLDLTEVINLGWKGPAVVGAVILLVRPAAVLFSVWPNHMPLKDRSVLALTAPRGIVAAAVASLAAHRMADLQLPGASSLEGLVYLTILITGAWSTAMAVVLPRVLGYVNDPSRRRAVLVGANKLTDLLAHQLQRDQRTVVVVDAVPWRLESFKDKGFHTVTGDARDAATYEQAGVERDTIVVAATPNDELNLLVADLVHAEFGVEHPVAALGHVPEDFRTRSRAWLDLLTGAEVDVGSWLSRLERGDASLVEVATSSEERRSRLRELRKEHPAGWVRLMAWSGGQPAFDGETSDAVVLLATDGPALAAIQNLADGEPTASGPSTAAPPAAVKEMVKDPPENALGNDSG
jgi:NhaP-type Na+/H+ or K+/H+ antiporter